jgi:hypothetical protein
MPLRVLQRGCGDRELPSPRRDLIVSLSPPQKRLKRRVEPRGHVRDNNWMDSVTIKEADFGDDNYPMGRFTLNRAR